MIPPVTAILALACSVAEPILMHFNPNRDTIIQARPRSREMIIRARHAWTWPTEKERAGRGRKRWRERGRECRIWRGRRKKKGEEKMGREKGKVGERPKERKGEKKIWRESKREGTR